MKKLILSILLTASQAIAGLPPTTTKGQSDASKSTTFDFQAPFSQFTKTSGTASLVETGNFNLLKNPGFEATIFSTNWTASGGSFTQGTSTNIGTGAKGAVFTPSGASQTVTSDAITIPSGMLGANASIACYFKTSGTDYTFSAYNGASNVASITISATTNFSRQAINFTMPTTGTIAARVSSGSAASSVSIDDCYLGPINTTTISNTSWSGYHANDCAWTSASASFADPADDASCTFTERVNNNFGTVTSFGSKKPGITFTPAATGRYYVCATILAYNDTATNYATFSLTDGTTEIAEGSARYPNLLSTPICGIYNATSTSSKTIKVQFKRISAGSAVIDGSNANAIEWSIFSID